MKLLVGADPELFIKKEGQFRSAHGLIAGTKKTPLKVDKGALQIDGTALEFNIDPASTELEFIDHIETVMSQLRERIEGYDITFESVADYTPDYLNTLPEEVLRLGCDPDYNAWTQRLNTAPDGESMFRTAAGHIHLGFCEDVVVTDPSFFEVCCDIVQHLDFYLGLPSLVFDPETRRREMYGKAGAFRPKVYGLEYRVLSNKWLENKDLMKWVYRSTIEGAESFFSGTRYAEEYGDIQEIINTSDTDRAMQIIDEIGLEIPNVY